MQIAAAIVCDAATIREGLLHILGGGITRLWRGEMPAPLGVNLAMLVEMEREVEDVPHEIRINLIDPDGARIGEVVGGLQYGGGARLEPGENHLLPVVVPLQQVGVGAFGRHRLEISLDGVVNRDIVVWVLHPDEQQLPPFAE